METTKNKFIAVAYELFAEDETGRHIVEKATADKPFTFISGFGVVLSDFEAALVGLDNGAEFDFTLTPEQAYGNYEEERVLELDREMFCIDGRFDHEHIRIDAIVPLQNQEGDRFMARVLDIRDQTVVMDLNHPLAGKTLNFRGNVELTRDATDDEVSLLIRQLTGDGGCGGCGGCDDGECGEGCEKHEGHCGKHKEGGCCHHS